LQQQLGVNEPDYGTLFSDTSRGESIERDRFIAPRVEAEIAFVLERDITCPDVTIAELVRSIAFAVPALEIVDSPHQGLEHHHP
jgi:2-keto-4-pentenoate hydratase